jgi:hypothetical protein
VPKIMPACVMANDNVGDIVGLGGLEALEFCSAAFARPKSRSFTVPSGVTLITELCQLCRGDGIPRRYWREWNASARRRTSLQTREMLAQCRRLAAIHARS